MSIWPRFSGASAAHKFARLTCVVFAVAAVLPAAAHAQTDADTIRKGHELAISLCAECHLNPGQGEKQGAMGIPGFSAVANRPLQTYDGVVSWLASIPPMMPNHNLSQDEMHALAAYIMSLRK